MCDKNTSDGQLTQASWRRLEHERVPKPCTSDRRREDCSGGMWVYSRMAWSRPGWMYCENCRPVAVRTEAQRTWRGWDPLKDCPTVEGHAWIME